MYTNPPYLHKTPVFTQNTAFYLPTCTIYK